MCIFSKYIYPIDYRKGDKIEILIGMYAVFPSHLMKLSNVLMVNVSIDLISLKNEGGYCLFDCIRVAVRYK